MVILIYLFLQVHDSSDTASAGSPANTISSTTPGAASSSSTSTALTVSFSQTTDQKAGEKGPDISVVSIGSSSIMTPQPLSSGAPTSSSNREDYDSSATVRPTPLICLMHQINSSFLILIKNVPILFLNDDVICRLRGPSDRDLLLVPGDGGRRSGRCRIGQQCSLNCNNH